MSPDTKQAVSVIIGIFVLVMLAIALLLYGWFAIIVLVLGLFVFAAVIGAMTNSDKKGPPPKRK